MAVTEAGNDPKVAALVYVSAFAPDVGESGSSLIGAHPAPPALSTIVTDSAGFVYQTIDGMAKNIAPHIPVAEAQLLAVTQGWCMSVTPLGGAEVVSRYSGAF